jgi:hypothetical protein
MTQEQPAAAYRLYFLGAHDHIEDVRVLDCASDREAVESARQFINGRDLELWDRGRFISRFPRSNCAARRAVLVNGR